MLDQRVQVDKFYEHIGDDHFTVYITPDKKVIEIEQYDSRAAYSKWLHINFWFHSAPAMIEAIQKAAGITTKYEYGIEETAVFFGERYLRSEGGRVWTDIKEHAQARKKILEESVHNNINGKPVYTYKLVRRPKQEGYEVLQDD